MENPTASGQSTSNVHTSRSRYRPTDRFGGHHATARHMINHALLDPAAIDVIAELERLARRQAVAAVAACVAGTRELSASLIIALA
jgi:hypothetical protein